MSDGLGLDGVRIERLPREVLGIVLHRILCYILRELIRDPRVRRSVRVCASELLRELCS